MEDIYSNIPAEQFQFVEKQDLKHEKTLVTKPRSYLADAFSRFCKNKGSIVGACVIFILVLYAIFGSIFSQYSVSHRDTYFRYALPKAELFANTNFWDGCENKSLSKATFYYYYYMGEETGHYAVKNQEYTQNGKMYDFRLDSYQKTGCVYMKMSEQEYLLLQQYQNETGKQVIYPALKLSMKKMVETYQIATKGNVSVDTAANYYYKFNTSTMEPQFDAQGNVIPDYKTHLEGQTSNDNYNSLRIAGDGENGIVYEYARPNDAGYEVRVNYYEYYIFNHTYVLKDGVTIFIFVERFLAIRKASVLDMNFMNRIRDYISDGKINAAVHLCKKTDTPIARMIEKGIERIGRPMSDVQTAIENVANLEVSKLENGLPFLATIAGGAPMIGFLGTVLGMVQTFMDMSAAGGTVDLGLLSSGMYVAMVTTVMGLIVGIPAYFGYNYLVARIEKLVFQMEANSIAFMDILNQPVQK